MTSIKFYKISITNSSTFEEIQNTFSNFPNLEVIWVRMGRIWDKEGEEVDINKDIISSAGIGVIDFFTRIAKEIYRVNKYYAQDETFSHLELLLDGNSNADEWVM